MTDRESWRSTLVSSVFSLEMSYVLLFASTRLKVAAVFAPLQQLIDLTLLAAVVCAATWAVSWLRERRQAPTAVLIWGALATIFVSVIALSALRHLTEPAVRVKFGEVIIMVSLSLAVGLRVGGSDERIRRLCWLLFVLGGSIAIDAIVRGALLIAAPSSLAGAVVGRALDDYHRVGRLGVVALLTGSILAMQLGGLRRILMIVLVLLCAIAVLLSGHRASILFAPAAALIAWFQLRRPSSQRTSSSPRRSGSVGLLVLAGAIVIGVAASIPQVRFGLYRIGRLTSAMEENARLEMWRRSVEAIDGNIALGVGLGRFPVATGMYGYRHPHNLFLESWLELGVVGACLAAFLLFAWLPFKRESHEHSQMIAPIVAVFWAAFFGAMVSGDLSDNRLVFLAAAVLTAAQQRVSSASGLVRAT